MAVAELLFQETPQLETERLILRRLTPADAEDIFAYASDDQVTQYLIWDTHASIVTSREFINFTLGRYARDEAGDWGIELKSTRQLIGTVGFAGCDRRNRQAEIGYVLARPYWGQGMMPEAVSRIIRFGFEAMGLNRIAACHFWPNEQSGRVMQKAGMSFEGVIREKLFAKGSYWDVKQYAILRSDWQRQTAAPGADQVWINTKLPGFKLRLAGAADVALILELIQGLADYENLRSEVVATEAVLKESLFHLKTAEVIIGEYEGKPVSFALFFHNFSTFLGRPGIYLEDLFVLPELRGKGIGQIILAYLAQLALERHCGRLEWWCLDWNEPAIRFYQKLGAVPMDQWTVYRVQGQKLVDLAGRFER